VIADPHARRRREVEGEEVVVAVRLLLRIDVCDVEAVAGDAGDDEALRASVLTRMPSMG
jgi:hypothetical protein